MEYAQREAYRDRKDAMEKVKAEQQRVQEEQQQELVKQHQENLAKEQEKLLEALPEWKDPDVAAEEKQAIISTPSAILVFRKMNLLPHRMPGIALRRPIFMMSLWLRSQ